MSLATGARCYLLTPPGIGAIGTIRVKGPDAFALVASFFRRGSKTELRRESLDRGSVLYGSWVENHEVIDDVLLSRDPDDPFSFDITAHGGVRIQERILETLERLGAPLADPAQIPPNVWPIASLIAREAHHELIRTTSPRAVRFLSYQLEHLAPRLDELAATMPTNPAFVRSALESMIAAYPAARRLIDGAVVAIVGSPNSGKSTLFNQLLGRSAAVVSDRPGTTRDWVSGTVELAGVSVTLIDTAGTHETADGLEQQAILSGRQQAGQADLIILLVDGAQPADPGASIARLARAWGPAIPALPVLSKLDLLVDSPGLVPSNVSGSLPQNTLRVSAKTGQGIELLIQAILIRLGLGDPAIDHRPGLFTARQVEAAHRASAAIGVNSVAAGRFLHDELVVPAVTPTREHWLR